MRLKKQLLIISILILILGCAFMLTSCDIMGFFNKKSQVVAPTITKVSMLKTSFDYLNSKEYLYNKDKGGVMPLNSGESFLLSIEYENPKNYPISYIKINNEKIIASKFEENSSKTNTIVKITVSETKFSLEEEYIVNSIYYNTGTETKRMAFNDAYEMTFKVIVEPSFYLTLNYQNADRRASTATVDQTSSRQLVKFYAELSSYSVVNKDYSVTVGLPAKPGGWVFEGYYTKPNGKGELVKSTDPYYFWGDITLYAHYSRIFNYEIVSLQEAIGKEKIDYTFTKDSKPVVKTFYNGVIITSDTGKGHPILDIGHTIVDEKITINENTGMATVTAVEYPVIKIGNKAFNNVNTVISLSIGKFVEEIGYYAFNNCNSLEKVSFPQDSQLKYIGDFAFQSTKLMGITFPFALPDNVEYLGNFAFRYSGWKNTINNGSNESILHIKPQYKFIGTGCFFQTQFTQVIFDPGCYYESQISRTEADVLEKAGGWQQIDITKNQIGANIFANCKQLIAVHYKNTEEDGAVITPAANIIPDRAYDGGNYTINGITVTYLNEGIEFIGEEAFNYQMMLTELNLPASLKEIGRKAFYNCVKIVNVNFNDSELNENNLEILHTMAFGNLASLSRVIIPSRVFTRYGNGPFSGCGKLKSIEFPNIGDISQVPRGFSKDENESEVYVGHTYSDLLYGTFESGELDNTNPGDETMPVTYSVPTRIFCQKAVLEKFKENILEGKKLTAGGQSSGTRAYEHTIFVYNIELVCRDHPIDPNKPEGAKTDIALQEIFYASGALAGYSLAFWSDRTKDIIIPSSLQLLIDGDLRAREIIEIGMYSLPTSMQTLFIPSTVKRIEHDAFNSCTSLTTVTFENPDSLEYIGENAFMGTQIKSFAGGANLKAIGQYAFWKCKALEWLDLSACTKITNVLNGRTELKTLYKFAYEKAAIDKGQTSNKDAIDYSNSLHYGAFQGCTALKWIYLPPNIMRMSRSLLDNCGALETVIIANPNIPTSTDYTDVGEICFYENGQATTVYDTVALAKGLTIYGVNLESTHKIVFPTGQYKLLENSPARPE